jgi:uncharacterized membrane protein
MEAFSDGVSTIAITSLVFELSVPAGSGDDLLKAAGERWPSYLAYVVSFSTVGRTVASTQCDHQLPRALEVGVVAAQLLVAHGGLVHAVPTRLLDEYIHEDRAERVAATIYGTSLLLASTLTSVLCRYAVHERLMRRRTAWTRAPNERSEAHSS